MARSTVIPAACPMLLSVHMPLQRAVVLGFWRCLWRQAYGMCAGLENLLAVTQTTSCSNRPWPTVDSARQQLMQACVRAQQFYTCAATGQGIPASLTGGGPAVDNCRRAQVSDPYKVRTLLQSSGLSPHKPARRLSGCTSTSFLSPCGLRHSVH